MNIVDEKGRLFGKVNVLDLIVVLLILAVAGRFGLRQFWAVDAAPDGEEKEIEIVVRLQAVAQPTIDFLPVGTELTDSRNNAKVGKIVAVRIEPALVVSQGDDGRVIETRSSDRFDYYLTVRGKAWSTANQLTMVNFDVKIGKLNYYKTRLWNGQGATWHIDENPPAR